MAIENIEQLFSAVLQAVTPNEVRTILDELGDHSEVSLNEEFGKLRLFWQPYGNKTSNYSSIGLASKPGRSLTERITNAIDAVIEEKSLKVSTRPDSPQAAVNEWFGRPYSTDESGLFNWNYQEGSYDKKVAVVLHNSGIKDAPTVDVVDLGLGIAAEDFPTTILSLQEGNKIKKKFVVGSFGQGGSSTLAFCDFVVVISRHVQTPDAVSFTIIREITLGEEYKENCYAYLAFHQNGKLTVPSLQHAGELTLYNQEKLRLDTLPRGTVVRHYAFRLNNLHSGFSSAEGNLYHYLHCSMFDPLIPFQVIDLRNPDRKPKQEIVKGSRNRLMGKVGRDPELDNSNTELKLYRPISYIKPHGADLPCIKVEYWVVFNYRKKGDSDEQELRGESNALFIQKKHFAVITMNGQNQGELTVKELIKDLGLDSVAKHMVIHIDATPAPGHIKRQLFTTNRESVKDEAVLDSIKREIRRLLEEDAELKELENFLVEKEIKEVTDTTDEEVKNQIVKLLKEQGFTPSAQGNVLRPAAGPNGPDPGSNPPGPPTPPRPPKPEFPIRTLQYPEVTRFEIVSPESVLKVRLNGSGLIKLETDADATYRDEVRIRIEPDVLTISTYVPLSGGRVKWRLRPKDNANVNDHGKVTATLTKSDGQQLVAEVDFEVIEPIEKPAKVERGLIPDFEVWPLEPEKDKWKKLWPDIEPESAEVSTVAYKAEKLGQKIVVFYSTAFLQFKNATDKIKNESALRKLFETNYKVWIGYHAILQMNSETDDLEGDQEDLTDQLKEKERSRVAQMQVKQALETANFMLAASKQKIAMT